jgi:Tfp pilus assembly protein PilF
VYPKGLRGFSTRLAHCSGGPRQRPSLAPPIQFATSQQAFNPSYACALYLGAVLFRQGDTAGAERAYREADQLEPNDPRALAARCQMYARQGNETTVAEVKRELTSRFPDRAEALAVQCTASD